MCVWAIDAAEEQLKLSEVSKLGIQADLGKIIIFICTNVLKKLKPTKNVA